MPYQVEFLTGSPPITVDTDEEVQLLLTERLGPNWIAWSTWYESNGVRSKLVYENDQRARDGHPDAEVVEVINGGADDPLP
jgi:hypothetical protein